MLGVGVWDVWEGVRVWLCDTVRVRLLEQLVLRVDVALGVHVRDFDFEGMAVGVDVGVGGLRVGKWTALPLIV